MSVISAIKTYMDDWIGEANNPLWVNFLKEEPVEYSIVPLGGTRKISEYIHGDSGERIFTFALQSNRFTADEADRVGSIELFENLAEWFDEQTEADDLPVLGSGYNALKIEALSFGYLFEQGESGTGIYQIQCALEYSKS